jgi:hypothetical protein
MGLITGRGAANAAFPHGALIVIHKYRRDPNDVPESVIPAGTPESRHKDVRAANNCVLRTSHSGAGQLPSMALDSSIPAGMTKITAGSTCV